MSASREKKQRQGAGPDQKALKAQQEQAARKRTAIIYGVIAAVIAALVVALLVWRSGFFQARQSALTVGDESLTTAELSFYYYDARRYYAAYGSYLGFDTSKADDEQFYSQGEGQTYRDYFMETALTNARQHKALADEAVKMGHTEDEIKDQVAAYIDNLKDEAAANGYSYSAYLRANYGPYVSSEAIEKLYTRFLMASLAASDKQIELYDGYTDADLDAYYKDNPDVLDTIEYSYLYFAVPTVDTKDEDGNELEEDQVQLLKDEAQADTKEKAETALAAVEGGSSFQSQADKYELTTTTSHGDHVTVVGTGSLNSNYSEQLLKLGKDKCELVEVSNGYYVISFHDRYLEDEPTRDVRHAVILAETTTDDEGNVAAPTGEAWAAAEEKIKAIQADYEAGEKSEDAFSSLVEEKSDDSSNLIDRIASNNTNLVPEFVDWTFQDHQPGDTGIIQHTARDTDGNKYWGYHLMYYVGENEPVWKGTVRSALSSADREEWISSLIEGYPTAEAGGANYLGH